jgi:catalase
MDALAEAGAVPRLLGSRLGSVTAEDGETFEVDATLENSPSVLFDAVILPDGTAAIERLSRDGHTLEFLKDQYRHCKTVLALGGSAQLLEKLGISLQLPSGEDDPGLLLLDPSDAAIKLDAFIAAVGRHRHPERDTDPPTI